jgi:hypothetical protein
LNIFSNSGEPCFSCFGRLQERSRCPCCVEWTCAVWDENQLRVLLGLQARLLLSSREECTERAGQN